MAWACVFLDIGKNFLIRPEYHTHALVYCVFRKASRTWFVAKPGGGHRAHWEATNHPHTQNDSGHSRPCCVPSTAPLHCTNGACASPPPARPHQEPPLPPPPEVVGVVEQKRYARWGDRCVPHAGAGRLVRMLACLCCVVAGLVRCQHLRRIMYVVEHMVADARGARMLACLCCMCGRWSGQMPAPALHHVCSRTHGRRCHRPPSFFVRVSLTRRIIGIGSCGLILRSPPPPRPMPIGMG